MGLKAGRAATLRFVVTPVTTLTWLWEPRFSLDCEACENQCFGASGDSSANVDDRRQ